MNQQADPPIIRMHQLTKRYGTLTAVDHCSLALTAGRSLALFGPSGCGKTTILRLLAGLEQPDQGEIYLHGRCVSTPGAVSAPHRRGIAMVFQDLALWPHLSVAQHLDFVMPATRSRKQRRPIIAKLLEQVQLHHRCTAYPDQLSGGERQRLALARALASEAKILLLDEPFANLDQALKQPLLAELKSLSARLALTLLYVSHQWQEVACLADRVAMMAAGRITDIVLPSGAEPERLRPERPVVQPPPGLNQPLRTVTAAADADAAATIPALCPKTARLN